MNLSNNYITSHADEPLSSFTSMRDELSCNQRSMPHRNSGSTADTKVIDFVDFRKPKDVSLSSMKKSSSLASFFQVSSNENKSSTKQSGYDRKLHPGTKIAPLRSCMKVATLNESLVSCDTIEEISSHDNRNNLRRSQAHSVSTPAHLCDLGGNEMRRNVSFNRIEIREYKRKLGDNPSVTRGAPVTLGWDVVKSNLVPIDEHELNRDPDAKLKKLSSFERELILRESGVSRDDIQKTVRDINRERRRRANTSTVAKNKVRSKMEEKLEGTERKLKRFLKITNTKKGEKQMWKEAKERSDAITVDTRRLSLSSTSEDGDSSDESEEYWEGGLSF